MSLYDYESDNRYVNSPAPFLEISLSNVDLRKQKLRSTCKALLDTGADNTLIPAEKIDEIQAIPDGNFKNFNGEKCYAHTVVIHFGTQKITQTVYKWNKPLAIIGRDFMSRYKITFDGINKKFNIYT